MKITEGVLLSGLKTTEAALSQISKAIRQISFVINGNLDLLTNLKVERHTVSFAAAGQELSLRHALKRKPNGYIVVSRSAAITVYDGVGASTDRSLYLRANGSGSVTILVF